jgi:tetratricopeptide (TPR) repeat protein
MHSDRTDFFISRRGSVARVAKEVTEVLQGKGYTVLTQDYDFPLTANFIEAMHEAVKNARDLVVLYTRDYETSPYTRKEFTSFEADRLQSKEQRRVVILRCEDVPLRGLFAPNIYQDLVGVEDPQERRRRIIEAAEGKSQSFQSPPRPFVGVPVQIANFTGRDGELDQLDAILTEGLKPAAVTHSSLGRAAVMGLGGVGKTSLAVEYAYRYRGLYSGVWWCAAETRISLVTALAGLLTHLGGETRCDPDLEVAAKAALRLLAEQRSMYLLVYDNASSPEVVADFLPTSGARVLITSRFADWGSWADEVPVDVLPHADAVRFLQARATRKDEEGASSLAKTVAGLPLALEHAAAYCKRTHFCFSDYAGKLTDIINTAPVGSRYPESVGATFELAITSATAAHTSSRNLVAYLAHCAPELIPGELVEGGVEEEDDRAAALLELSEISLIKAVASDGSAPAVTMHRLVQAVAREYSFKIGDHESAIRKLRKRLGNLFPIANRILLSQLMPHVLVVCKYEGETSEERLEQAALCNRAASYLQYQSSNIGQYVELFRRALAIYEKEFSNHHPETAKVMNNLGYALRDQGAIHEPALLFKRALKIYDLYPESAGKAVTLSNLAHFVYSEGMYVEMIDEEGNYLETSGNDGFIPESAGARARARTLYQRALGIFERVDGPESIEVARALQNLGVLAENNEEERALFARALEILKSLRKVDPPFIAAALANIASLDMTEGKYDEARSLYQQALSLHQEYNPKHPATAHALDQLAYLLETQGNLEEAKELYQEAYVIRDRFFGPDHRATIISLERVQKLSVRVTAQRFRIRTAIAQARMRIHKLLGGLLRDDGAWPRRDRGGLR